MQNAKTEIEATGTQLLGISYDDAEKLREFATNKNITFPLVSDTGSTTIKAYGIHHQDGYPHPGTFVVNKQGIVTAALFEDDFKVRHSVADLVQVLKGKESK